MRRTISIFLLSFALFTIIFCFFGCDKEDTKDTKDTKDTINDISETISTQPLTNDQQTDVQKALSNTVQIMPIDDVSGQGNSNTEDQSRETSMKTVTISIVDLSKVYKYFAENNESTEFDLQKIEQFIDENQSIPEFLSDYSIEAEVIDLNASATIDEAALQNVFVSQAEAIMRDRVSEFNVVEVEVIPLQTEEND